MGIISSRATHAARLERWLGLSAVEHLSRSMGDWYGPPIPVAGVPGMVYAHRGGDFSGPIKAGQLGSLLDFTRDRSAAILKRWAHRQLTQVQMAGFAGLSDLIAEATQGGKRQELVFSKSGSTQVAFGAGSYWQNGTAPAAGAAGSAAPAGRAPTSATTGAVPFTNAASGDYLHFIGANYVQTAQAAILLYDRIFDVAKTASSTATEAVTGVPTRYQNTTATAMDYGGGNFVFPEAFAALGATAHNWTVCKYTNQAGVAGQTMPSIAGVASQIINALDLPLARWFMDLQAGDAGIGALTQMQNSASVTGAVNFVIGHPIAWFPVPVALSFYQLDGINTAFNLTRIFDAACLAFLNVMPIATTAPTFTGSITAVSG